MGGRSSSSLKNTSTTSVFQGFVSLQNGGGFASMRAALPFVLDAGCTGIRIRIRGDGNTYGFRLRCRGRYARIAYRVNFTPEQNQMDEFFFSWDMFTPTFRGKVLSNIPSPQPELIREVGFLIAQQQDGPFALELDWIRAEKP